MLNDRLSEYQWHPYQCVHTDQWIQSTLTDKWALPTFTSIVTCTSGTTLPCHILVSIARYAGIYRHTAGPCGQSRYRSEENLLSLLTSWCFPIDSYPYEQSTTDQNSSCTIRHNTSMSLIRLIVTLKITHLKDFFEFSDISQSIHKDGFWQSVM